jgi:hypothetical protein
LAEYKLKARKGATIYGRLDLVARLIDDMLHTGSKDDVAAFAAQAELEIAVAKAQLLQVDRALIILAED